MKRNLKVVTLGVCLSLLAAMAAGCGSDNFGEDKQIVGVETDSAGAEAETSATEACKEQQEMQLRSQNRSYMMKMISGSLQRA